MSRRVDFVEQAFERAVLPVDRAAQTRLARIELITPSPGRGVEDGRGVFGAVADQRRKALARSDQSILQSLTPHDDSVVQAIGSVVEAYNQLIPMDENSV